MVLRSRRQRYAWDFSSWRGIATAAGLGLLILLPMLVGAPGTAAGEEKEDAYAWRLGVKKGLEVHGVSCLRIHPRAAGTLWAHVHGIGPAHSEDGGKTWLPSLKGIPKEMRPGLRSQVRISLDPRDAKTLYVVCDGQIYKSEDAGENWSSITSGALVSLSWDKLSSAHLSWEVRVDLKKSVRLLVGTRTDGNHNGGLFESTDGGKSWEEIAGTALNKSKLGPDALFVRLDPKTEKVMTVAGRHAVYYSDDRGRIFERRDPGGLGAHDIRGLSNVVGKDLYLADARGIWRSKTLGSRWDKKPLARGDALGVFTDAHSKKRLYAIWHDRGLEISEDSSHKKWRSFGGPWTPPGTEEKKDAKGADERPGGYLGAVIREVYTHPKNRKMIYLASPVTGLHVSEDGGESFQPVVPPADHDADAPTKVIPAVTPAMALVGVHASRGGAHLAVSEQGVVYRSDDRCESWQRVGLLGQAPGVLVPDTAPNTWLAGGRTLLRSSDNGASWLPLYPPRDGRTAIDPEAKIVAIHRGKPDGDKPGAIRILIDRDGIVLTSRDDGVTWQASKAPEAITSSSETWAADFAVDSANEDHLVVAARTTKPVWNSKDENGGVFESWDGGKNWTDLTPGLALGEKDTSAERKAKAGWNRARFVEIDTSSGLIIYGADQRGILVRPYLNPKSGDKVEQDRIWTDVTPAEPAGASIAAHVQTITADRTDSRLFVQLRARAGQNRCYDITGRMLRRWYDSIHPKKDAEPEKDAKPAAWTNLPSPGAEVILSSVAADLQLPGRLVGSDSEGAHGILVFEIPGSKPEEPTKEPKKDEAKKDEEGKGAAVAPMLQPPEGMRAFSAGQDKTIRVWSIDKGEKGAQITGHENAVFCIALSPDETHILTGSKDRTLRVWNAANGSAVATIRLEGAARGIAIDDDSEFAYVAMGETLLVAQVEIATQKVKTLAGHKKAVRCVATSEDVNRAYSGGDDDVIIVWDTKKGAEVNAIVMGSPVIALAVATDGTRIYAAGQDNAIAAFDAAGKPAGRLDKLAAAANALALSPDGTLLYATTENGVLAITTKDMQIVATHAAPSAGALRCVETSADGLWIFAGDDKGGLWMWAKGQVPAFRPRLQGHEGPLHGLCVTPDETELAAEPDAAAKPDAKDGAAEPKKDAPERAEPPKAP